MNRLAAMAGATLVILGAAWGQDQDTTDFVNEDSVYSPPRYVEISGNLPELLANELVPYLVVADIVVPPGQSTVIEPGVRLLFRNFTGLQIHGTLLAQGSPHHPIVFTSENDSEHGSTSGTPPAPYDWNGITISENAIGTTFEQCKVLYSLFGINSMAEYIAIRECYFSQNGRADLSVRGIKQDVNIIPYTYLPRDLSNLPQEPTPASVVQVEQRRGTSLRVVSVLAMLGGAAVGVWKTVDYQDSQAHFEDLSDLNRTSNYENSTIGNDWEKAKTTRDTDKTMMISGFGLAGLGVLGFGLSFTF